MTVHPYAKLLVMDGIGVPISSIWCNVPIGNPGSMLAVRIDF